MRELMAGLGLGFVLVVGDCEEEMERSDVRASRVSAATMPPMECPIRIVWTEGSIVGEGVRCETSISITFSRSLSGVVSLGIREGPCICEVWEYMLKLCDCE